MRTDVFEQEATVSKWDEDYYHPIALSLYDHAIADMLRLMEAEPGATILDAGCGPGVHSIRVAKAGYDVCAIDISKQMLEHARERARDAHILDRVEFHEKDITNLDFPDASFRYVFSWGVVIHIRDAEKALDELCRIVKPGGKLALYVTNKTAVDHKIESLVRFIARKPLVGMQHLELGDGIWCESNGQKLWVWRMDARAVINYLAEKGFQLVARRIGELSQIQWRLRGFTRRLLLHLNNASFRLRFPPRIGCTTLFVFEKTPE